MKDEKQNVSTETTQTRTKYDPQQAYFDRMNQTQRVNLARHQQHQFADSIGGCGSNYRF